MNKKEKTTLVSILTFSLFLSACGSSATPTTAVTPLPEETTIEKQSEEPTITEQTEISEISEESPLLPEKLYVGDEITLGTYEQDNNLENGAEDIEWIVLDKISDYEYLCISKYVLDAQYFKECKDIDTEKRWEQMDQVPSDWDNSTIKKWLNSTFYDTAFTEQDKKYIAGTGRLSYGWKSYSSKELSRFGHEDKVCLLDWDEFDLLPSGCVKVTEYAKRQGAPFVDDGTREHENCSDGWLTMTINVDKCEEKINDYIRYQSSNEVAINLEYYVDEIVEFKHDSLEDYNIDHFSEKSGIRPVITVYTYSY